MVNLLKTIIVVVRLAIHVLELIRKERDQTMRAIRVNKLKKAIITAKATNDTRALEDYFRNDNANSMQHSRPTS